MYWHETVNPKKNPNPALALNAEKPRQRKVRSAVCIQSPQARAASGIIIQGASGIQIPES